MAPRKLFALLASTAAAALATTATMTAAQTTSSATCSSVTPNALSFSCGTACKSWEACVGGGSDGACSCLDITRRASDDETKTMRLLVRFGAYKSAQELAKVAIDKDVLDGDNGTRIYATASNDKLTSVDQLKLPTNITRAIIRGGDSLEGLTKYRVANVSFNPQFLLSASKQLTYLKLENFAIGSDIDKMIGNFPLTVTNLLIRNNLIPKFPANLQNMGSLRVLYMGYNDIETIDKADRLTDLTELRIRNNKIKTFNALFPKLEYLDLLFNQLDGVPEVVPQHTFLKSLLIGGNDNTIPSIEEKHVIKTLEMLSAYDASMVKFDAVFPSLKQLYISSNSFTELQPKFFLQPKLEELELQNNKKLVNVSFTNQQANFIYNLKSFKISNSSLSLSCDASQKYTFAKHNITACISEPINKAAIEGPLVLPATKAPGSGSGSGTTGGSGSESSGSNLGAIIGGVAGAVVVIAIIAFFVVRRNKKAKADEQNKMADTMANMTGTITGTITGTNGGTSLWMDQDLLSLKVSSDDITDVKKIGNGAFADVWLVKFRGSELMASKRLRESGVTRPQVQSFIEEIKLVSTLKHPSIVELKGVAWVRESDLQALFEYMDSGDLRDYLAERASGPRQWDALKLQVAIDIAEALVYVHSFMPPLVHRDLKSRNVLLNNEGGSGVLRAKLTDFGVSRFRSEDNTMTSGVGTGRWLAPEVIAGDGNYGPAADIFSFGALLFELDTHEIPYSDVRGANGNKLADVALLQLVASGELKPTMSATCPEKIAELANRCFALSPSERPAAPEIAYALRTLQKNMRF